jgi:V/A-type H+/Na+-transporting ATPase subunit I
MIVKMKKYAFLIYHKEYHRFLESLRETGVLHVTPYGEGVPDDENIAAKMKLQNRVQNAIRILENRKTKGLTISNVHGNDVLSSVERIQSALEVSATELQHVEKEIAVLLPWGEFTWDNLHKLAGVGKHIHFFISNRSKYNPEWENQFHAFQIAQYASQIYFVTVSETTVAPAIEADLVKLPREGFKEIAARKSELLARMDEQNRELDVLALSGLHALKHLSHEIHNEVNFETILLHTGKEAGERVMLLEGWVPEETEADLVNMLELSGYFFWSRNVEKEDEPPVLLKNNWFARLFEPIGALYALPSYRELDLTPYFAPFYWLFFGFCLGDAGYGLLIMAAGAALLYKGKSEQMKNIMKLVILLGISTILFGIITGTVFGLNLYDKNWAFYGSINEILAAKGKSINDVMFMVAIAFGAVQILFGILLKAFNEIKQQGMRYAIGTFGWLILLVGTALMYFLKKPDQITTSHQITQYAIWGVSGVMIFLFNAPGKGILANIGLGLWGTYNMATGLLGDLLSYIRLFALGISSAILGYVFNMLSAQLSGSIPVLSLLIMMVILLVGHGINIFMSSLGSFVHSMRLTFVEFYKNTGFDGRGKAYQPFSKR